MRVPTISILLSFAVANSVESMAGVDESTALSLHEAFAHPCLRCSVVPKAGQQLSVTLENRTAGPIMIALPAGLSIAGPSGGAGWVILRSTTVRIAAHSAAEAVLPAAMRSWKTSTKDVPLRPVDELDPALETFIGAIAAQPDFPRATAQFAVLALLEDATFAQGCKALAGGESGSAEPTSPAQVASAIDALGLLRQLAPTRKFALGEDADLKRRALRNPWSRAKAMQLYGLTLPGDASPEVPPELGRLLHTQAGDNCPICRTRSILQRGPSDL